MSINKSKYNHYFKAVPLEEVDGVVRQVTHIDVYNVLSMWDVFSHPVGHAIKKLLCPGERGDKDYKKDIKEAIACLQRELELQTQHEVRYSVDFTEAAADDPVCTPEPPFEI